MAVERDNPKIPANNYTLPDGSENLTLKDAFSNNLIYVSSRILTKNNVCSAHETGLKLKDLALNLTIPNVAFLVFSKGSDCKSNTYCNKSLIMASGTCMGTVETNSTADIVAYVTLPQLKKLLNCPSRVRILNDELPPVVPGEFYNATVYSDGGVPPYAWWINGSLIEGLNYTSEGDKLLIFGNTSKEEKKLITICVSDSYNSTDCKDYSISSSTVVLPSGNSTSPVGSGGSHGLCSSYILKISVYTQTSCSPAMHLYYSYNDLKGIRHIFVHPGYNLMKTYTISNLNITSDDRVGITFFSWCGFTEEYKFYFKKIDSIDSDKNCIAEVFCNSTGENFGKKPLSVSCSFK